MNFTSDFVQYRRPRWSSCRSVYVEVDDRLRLKKRTIEWEHLCTIRGCGIFFWRGNWLGGERARHWSVVSHRGQSSINCFFFFGKTDSGNGFVAPQNHQICVFIKIGWYIFDCFLKLVWSEFIWEFMNLSHLRVVRCEKSIAKSVCPTKKTFRRRCSEIWTRCDATYNHKPSPISANAIFYRTSQN